MTPAERAQIVAIATANGGKLTDEGDRCLHFQFPLCRPCERAYIAMQEAFPDLAWTFFCQADILTVCGPEVEASSGSEKQA
jgi:hypothetical protein